MTALLGRLHQLMNCWLSGVSKAGLTLRRLEYKPLCDLRFGPFAAQAHHSTLIACAREYFACQDWTSPLFEVFFDDIAEEQKCTNPDWGSERHKREVWERLRAQLVNAKQGAHVREGRWWNLESRALAVTEAKTGLLLLLLYLGFQRKWWCTFAESPLGKLDMFVDGSPSDRGEGLPASEEKEEGGDEEELAGEGVHEDEGDEPMDADDGRSQARMSRAACKEAIREKRKKCAISLHYSCLLLAEQGSTRIVQGMCHLARPLMRAFGDEEKMLMDPTTPGSSSWGWLEAAFRR